MQIGVVFDEMANEYARIMETMVPHYRKLLTTMLAELDKDFVASSILDLGCGDGNVTGLCKKVWPEARFHLVDASREMLDRCIARFGHDNMIYEQVLFEEMELPSQSYDLVCAGFSLHHVEGQNKQHVFERILPALRPGGILTSADLFIEKEDEPFHGKVLAEWKQFLFSNGRNEEDWQWLTDHYMAYDRPSSFKNQEQWLHNAGFSRVRYTWHDGPWGCFHAWK